MTRNLLAFCGLLALVVALGIWQFGFFSDVSQHIERETAVARAQRVVRNMDERASALTDRARKLRIDARTREKSFERDEEQSKRTKQALVALAAAANDAGFQRPTVANDDDLTKTLAFAGKTMTGSEVYETLERWQKSIHESEARLSVERSMIDRIRDTADELEEKQTHFVTQIQSTRATLERLELQRDLAALDKELAELGANASGNPAGELKDILDTLQLQIDEFEATSEVLAAEPASNLLTPEEALAGNVTAVTIRQELDSLWEK